MIKYIILVEHKSLCENNGESRKTRNCTVIIIIIIAVYNVEFYVRIRPLKEID